MRDIQVPPILVIGCIGPAFLCVLTVGLIYGYSNLPLWTHGPELQAALEHYEQVRAAVFQGHKAPDTLEDVAVEPHLRQLQTDLNLKRDTLYSELHESIVIAEIREYTDTCSVVVLANQAAFILERVDDVWKVAFMTDNYRPGIAGSLPLHPC